MDGAQARAPKGCAAETPYGAASTAGLFAVDVAEGTFAPIHVTQGHLHANVADRLAIPEGGDVLMLNLTATPGSSRGWSRHAPAVAFIRKGQFATYVPTDDGCVKVETIRAGDIVTHAQYADHLTVVEGTEPAELTGIYWGMGNNPLPMPGLADFVEANDFTPALPAGCTVL